MASHSDDPDSEESVPLAAFATEGSNLIVWLLASVYALQKDLLLNENNHDSYSLWTVY